MPELPEVETVRMALEPALVGRRFAHVLQRRPDLRFPFPERFTARLEGQTIAAVRRRAKYLLIDLSGGESLIIHLGMSGRITISPSRGVVRETARLHHNPAGRGRNRSDEFESHDHVVFKLDDGVRIVFNDHRRFGLMDLVVTDQLEICKHFRRMGPEPLGNGFSAAYLSEALGKRRTPIKAALLDQRLVAGLGNIYVCEALFRAAISPRRLAHSVKGRRAERLAPEIRAVLQEAIRAGGSSLRDYRQADGSLGYFQHTFSVYDREGQDCVRPGCGGRVQRIVQAGRSTFLCGRCQR